jgi:hypothetical protein
MNGARSAATNFLQRKLKMRMGSSKARSRDNMKQIIAHVPAEMKEAVERKTERENLTQQEIIALAVNFAVADYGRTKAYLKVGRDRVVRRRKGQAQVITGGPDCRVGKRRLAAYFDKGDVAELEAFVNEVGTNVNHLIKKGLPEALKYVAPAALVETTSKTATAEHREAA